ncbi:glycolate oxidase subunit GlcE [Crenalkalicoccus roseus]|uniref:glycolate oxidase subunit GlcE n=1 Tax=Crenalkalicoccus roseus TaxID=1485588 RepID=UPI0010818EC5|nr:glycolate oxidase subunit GlcE [Crenalkalicoccus roseus]
MSGAEAIAPATEEEVAAAVAAAAAAGEPLAIEGNATKRAMLRPVQAARRLTLAGLTGITLYRPQELVIAARAGTPLPEIEAALAEKGQHLIAEPPDFRGLFGAEAPATLGGTVAANLSGPRRIASGAMRDHVIGIRAVNGRGEVFRSGGRVLKNVTGLDLCKLLTGAHGTLGVLTEITLKVLPAPEASGSLAVRVPDLAAGVRALCAGLGSPYGVSGAALLPEGVPEHGLAGPVALLRIEDFADSVAYRLGRLRGELAPHGAATPLEEAASRALWRAVRDAVPLGAAPEEAVWRVSVRPTAGPDVAAALRAAFGARLLLDWGGGLVWAAGPATAEAHEAVVRAAREAGGSFLLFRAPEPLRAAVAVMPEEPPPLAAIARRVKAVMDPAGVLNPGRMRAGF